MKRTIPLIIASVTGFVLVGTFFIPYTRDWGDEVLEWFNILAAIAFILGGGNLMKLSLQKISYKRPGWGYAAVTIIAFIATLVIGLGKFGVAPVKEYPTYSLAGPYDEQGSGFWWIFEYVYYPLAATMFSLLAFFIASAAFRAFRAKNVEATILLSTAFIVLLGRTYAGVFLTSWLPDDNVLRLDNMTEWIMNNMNTAGMRAITIGIALGIMSTSLKVLLGVDRSYIGTDDG